MWCWCTGWLFWVASDSHNHGNRNRIKEKLAEFPHRYLKYISVEMTCPFPLQFAGNSISEIYTDHRNSYFSQWDSYFICQVCQHNRQSLSYFSCLFQMAIGLSRLSDAALDTSLLIKHLEQAQQLSVSRGGHRGWEGEDHQLVRICLKKQRRAKRKGTKRSLGDVFCGSQKKFPRG